MSNNANRIHELSARRKQLDLQINAEESRPSPDTLLLHELKRRKLRLKDEINSLDVNSPSRT